MAQIFNFNSGPAILSAGTFKQAQQELRGWNGLGASVVKVGCRGKEFIRTVKEAEEDLRDFLDAPSNYKMLFCHGGDRGQSVAVSLNILSDRTTTDYIDAGHWVASIIKEAKKYCTSDVFDAKVIVGGLHAVRPMNEWQLSDNATYIYYCPNETTDGIVIDETPDFGKDVAVAADFSLTILSRPIDISRCDAIYAGAQGNIGPAGLTIVVVREDLLGKTNIICPPILGYSILNDNDSVLNTPPAFAWHLSGLVFEQLKVNGGVTAIDKTSQQKTELLYGVIDNSDFYHNDVARANRPRIGVPFQLMDSALDKLFFGESFAVDLYVLKGHRVVGGMCASIYNAMLLGGVRVLIDFMVGLERCHG